MKKREITIEIDLLNDAVITTFIECADKVACAKIAINALTKFINKQS